MVDFDAYYAFHGEAHPEDTYRWECDPHQEQEPPPQEEPPCILTSADLREYAETECAAEYQSFVIACAEAWGRDRPTVINDQGVTVDELEHLRGQLRILGEFILCSYQDEIGRGDLRQGESVVQVVTRLLCIPSVRLAIRQDQREWAARQRAKREYLEAPGP